MLAHSSSLGSERFLLRCWPIFACLYIWTRLQDFLPCGFGGGWSVCWTPLAAGAGRCVLLSGGGLTSDLLSLTVFVSPPFEKMSSSLGFAGAVYLLIMLLLFARPPSFLSLLR